MCPSQLSSSWCMGNSGQERKKGADLTRENWATKHQFGNSSCHLSGSNTNHHFCIFKNTQLQILPKNRKLHFQRDCLYKHNARGLGHQRVPCLTAAPIPPPPVSWVWLPARQRRAGHASVLELYTETLISDHKGVTPRGCGS